MSYPRRMGFHISGRLVPLVAISSVGVGSPHISMAYDNAVSWIDDEDRADNPEAIALFEQQAAEAQQFIELCGQRMSVADIDSGNHADEELASAQPERSSGGAAVTWELLQMLGTELHSNAFNPIDAGGIELIRTQLEDCGSPIRLDGAGGFGPWGIAQLSAEPLMCGGWDQQTLHTAVECVWSTTYSDAGTPLSELGLWMERAANADGSTLWIAIL